MQPLCPALAKYLYIHIKKKKALLFCKAQKKNARETFGETWWPSFAVTLEDAKENQNNSLGGTMAGAEG